MSILTGKPLFLLSSFYFIYSIRILILATPELVGRYCDNDFNYTTNSIFKTNLDRALATLPTTNTGYGFFNSSSGQNSDTAFAMALCRGDTIKSTTCDYCVNISITRLRQECPQQRYATIYYDICTLIHSNDFILGNTQKRWITPYWNPINVTDTVGFNRDLLKMLDNITAQAASGGVLKYATGSMTRSNGSKTYGLLQCTPDQSSQRCSECLGGAISRIEGCCFGRIGANVFQPTCNLRYENFQFYNDMPELVLPTSPSTLAIPAGKHASLTRIVTFTVMATIAFVIIVVSIFTFLMLRKKKQLLKSLEQMKESTSDMSITVESLEYDFGTVSAATNCFSQDNKIGQGGFGSVYKGKLEDGSVIAVKRLSMNSEQGEEEFKNEVMLVAKLHHRNLVRLLGFSIQGIERLLIYEFLPNTSLDKLLFDPDKRTLLNWDTSYNIIQGVARGLLYLHEDSRIRMIHRDLKASNILLDDEMNAKITDFGMARLFKPDESRGNTRRVVGTYGYMAPEYVMHGQFSVKLDVFSFGVLLLEIITGRQNFSFENEDGVYLLSNAWRSWRNGTLSNIIDPRLLNGSDSLNDILRCIHIALLCVQKNVVDRPTISSIVVMLNSFSLSLQVPEEPAFFIANSIELKEAQQRHGVLEEGNNSLNDASVSELTPR